MEPFKTDRRIKYTKKLLADALASLLQHQHISSVSVKSCANLRISTAARSIRTTAIRPIC